MKKSYLRIIPFFFAGTFFLASCNKEDDIKKDDPMTQYPSEFSDKTVAENKADLEDNGIEMVNNLTELKNTSGINGSISFTHFLSMESGSSMERNIADQPGVSIMKTLSDFAQGKTTADKVLANMRTAEHGSIQESFDQFKGVHSWNSSTETWDFDATGDRIVFKFPSTTTGTSNNASFSIFNYTGVEVANPTDDYTGDLPTSVNAEYVVDGKKEIEYSFTASYNSKGEPTAVSTILTINPFTLSVSASNSVSEARADYSLKKADKTLLAFGVKVTGNLDSDNMENSESASDVIETSNAYFQLMNVKLTGEANVKAIEAELGDGATVDEEIATLNKNYKLVLSWADSNQKIADTEFYKNEDGDASLRLIFADGSKADAATYFGEGFQTVEDKFFDFTADVESDL